MFKLKKLMASIASVCMGGFLLAGCGGNPNTADNGSNSNSGSPTTVTIWSWRSQDAPLWQQVQDALNKNGANVKIDFRAIQPTSYNSVLQTAMDGGKGPDLMYMRAGLGVQQYAAANMLMPLDNLVDFSQVNKGALSEAQYQGKTYGVPFAIQTMEVFYNKDTFAKYNLSEPKTWDDFIKICQTLKSNGVTPLAAMGIQPWTLALASDEVSATLLGNDFAQKLVQKQVTLDSPEYIDALAHFQQLADYFEPNFKAVGSSGDEADQMFALGKAAMVMDGIFNVPKMLKFNPNLNLGAFLIPPVDPSKQHAQIEWYDDGAISVNSKISDPKVQKAAEEIIKYTATKEFGQAFSNIAGEISPIAGVEIPSKFPLSVQAYRWYQTVPINPPIGIRSPLDIPPPTPINQTTNAANTTMGIYSAKQQIIVQMLTKDLTPEQTAKKLQDMLSWYFKK